MARPPFFPPQLRTSALRKQQPKQRRALASWRVALAGLVLVGVFSLFLPWRGNIWSFDPDGVARLETDMWRHYYEKRFVALAFGLYAGVRENYRISPWDAALTAWDTANAARTFQSSRDREAAKRAIPILEKAYRRLARATNATFDARRAATLELEWWQQRREHAPPEIYAQTIAMLAREIYSGGEDSRIDAAALERANAMAFRDAHRNSKMTDGDWDIVKGKLIHSYRLLHEALIGKKRDREDPVAIGIQTAALNLSKDGPSTEARFFKSKETGASPLCSGSPDR